MYYKKNLNNREKYILKNNKSKIHKTYNNKINDSLFYSKRGNIFIVMTFRVLFEIKIPIVF